jgi:hypothetical protein
MSVDPNTPSMPRVKLERTDIEVSLHTKILKQRNDRDNDDIKVVSQRRKKGGNSIMPVGDKII